MGSRKERLAPLERDLLWELEESGGGYLVPMANVALERTAIPREDLISQLEVALNHLLIAGLVTIESELVKNGAFDQAMRVPHAGTSPSKSTWLSLDQELLWDAKRSLWVSKSPGVYVMVVITDKGADFLRR